MTLELNARKLLGLFALIWPLIVLALLINPKAWTPWQIATVAAIPLVSTIGLWMMGRRRWRLEATPDALVHHTLGRTERFDWRLMGPFVIAGPPLPQMIGVRRLRFAYPAEPDGSGPERSLLLVFGDQSARDTAATLDRFRHLYLQVPPRPVDHDRTIRLPMNWARLTKAWGPVFFLVGAGVALAASWAPFLDSKITVIAVGLLVMLGLALVARDRGLTLTEDGLIIHRWGRDREISWVAIEDAVVAPVGVWVFRRWVMTLTERTDRGPFPRVRLGDLYGSARLVDILAEIDARRVAAIEAINAD